MQAVVLYSIDRSPELQHMITSVAQSSRRQNKPSNTQESTQRAIQRAA